MLYLTDVYHSIKEQLTIPYADGVNFGAMVSQCEDPLGEKIVEDLSWQISRITDEPFNISYGCSKLAIVFKRLPYVIKIPFQGEFYSCEDGDYYNDYFCGSDFIPFDTLDYCKAETDKYNALKEQNLEMFFAKTLFYGYTTIDNYPLYLQEKIKPAAEYSPSFSYDNIYLYQTYRQIVHSTFIDDCNWISTAIHYFGLEKLLQLTKYTYEIDPSLNCDMHKKNYGYRANGEPAVLDFTGFDS